MHAVQAKMPSMPMLMPVPMDRSTATPTLPPLPPPPPPCLLATVRASATFTAANIASNPTGGANITFTDFKASGRGGWGRGGQAGGQRVELRGVAGGPALGRGMEPSRVGT